MQCLTKATTVMLKIFRHYKALYV